MDRHLSEMLYEQARSWARLNALDPGIVWSKVREGGSRHNYRICDNSGRKYMYDGSNGLLYEVYEGISDEGSQSSDLCENVS